MKTTARRLAAASLFSSCLALLPRAASAYLASPPDQPPREVTTIEELEDYYRAKPELAKEWNELRQQLKDGDRPGKAEEPKPEAKDKDERQADDVRLTEKRGPGAAGAAGLGSDGKPGLGPDAPGQSAMGQLKGAADSAGAPAPSAPTAGEGQQVFPPFKDPLKEVEGPMKDKDKARAVIAEIAKAKGEGEKIRKLYQDELTKVYFSETKFSGPLVRAEVDYIRKGVNSGNWKDFPTAAFGGVPPGAAATWQGSGNFGGGHITMAPGLTNLRVFDHEFLHHSDAGHADRTPIGVNELHSVEPPCYKYMGCAPGMGGGGC